MQPFLFSFVVFSFLLPRSFFFSFPFPLLVWFWRLSGPRNLSFDAFSLKWRQMSLGWFLKNRPDILVTGLAQSKSTLLLHFIFTINKLHLHKVHFCPRIYIYYLCLSKRIIFTQLGALHSAKIPEISFRNQMERTISIGSDRNIWDHLWRPPLWPVRSFR